MKTIIQPIADRIAIVRMEDPGTTTSGLIKPDIAQERLMTCKVIATGPGRRSEGTGLLIPMQIKVGDIVSCLASQALAMPKIKDMKEKYYIIRELDVAAIIEQQDSQEKTI